MESGRPTASAFGPVFEDSTRVEPVLSKFDVGRQPQPIGAAASAVAATSRFRWAGVCHLPGRLGAQAIEGSGLAPRLGNGANRERNLLPPRIARATSSRPPDQPKSKAQEPPHVDSPA